MSKFYEMAKANYPDKWNISMLRNLVAKGRITAEEFFEITGEAYE
ncbi:MAG: XkdX family protein [Lachnospiraceae bacterium]|nr:XkdX family protein [Lachnospiraceae bacterium]